MIARILSVLPVVLLLTGCQPEVAAEPPAPVAMNAQAVGHYCQMDVLEHEGPKAQIHVANLDRPLWFSQIRDAVAFTKLPEETDEVLAIYVNDMAKANSWADPGAGNWISADKAHFVINSTKTGGMGAPEAVPFGDMVSAEAFVSEYGGQIVRFNEIPDEYVLSPVDVLSAVSSTGGRLQ